MTPYQKGLIKPRMPSVADVTDTLTEYKHEYELLCQGDFMLPHAITKKREHENVIKGLVLLVGFAQGDTAKEIAIRTGMNIIYVRQRLKEARVRVERFLTIRAKTQGEIK